MRLYSWLCARLHVWRGGVESTKHLEPDRVEFYRQLYAEADKLPRAVLYTAAEIGKRTIEAAKPYRYDNGTFAGIVRHDENGRQVIDWRRVE